MSQVYGFAKQSTGEVSVKSVVGQGSTFTLYLPHVPSVEKTPDRSADMAPHPFVGGGARILVVEDNEAVGRFASEMLHDLGCLTFWALNADEALKVLAAEGGSFGLVFSDVIMPGMNGVDLADEIRRRYPTLPVVRTSGYSNVLAKRAATALNCCTSRIPSNRFHGCCRARSATPWLTPTIEAIDQPGTPSR